MRPFDENDLIAFHLGELPPRRRLALEDALRTDSVLARDAEEIAATLQQYRGHTAVDLDRHLVDRNWLALEPIIMKAPPAPAPRFHWHAPSLFAGGAAALAACSLLIAVHDRAKFTTAPQDAPAQSQTQLPPGSPLNGQTPPAGSAPAPGSAPLLRNTAPLRPGTPPLPASEGSLIRHAIRPSRQQLFAFTPAPTHNDQGLSALTTPASPLYPGAPGSPVTPSATQTASQPYAQRQAAQAPPPSPTGATAQAPVHTASAATGAPAPAARPGSRIRRHTTDTDITLAMGGTFIPTRDGDRINNTQYAQGATHAISAIASFHQQFRPLAGYRLTASYTRPDFHYLDSTYGQQEINGRVFELAATYVVQGPRRGRISTAAEAGAGAMTFIATIDSPDTSSNTRVAGILGFSTQVAINSHLAVQAAYRGQIFQGPDFRANKTAYPLVTNTSLLVSHEPSLGVTWHFHPKRP